MTDPKYTVEQLREANDAFKLKIGRTVAVWGFVETGLCNWFQKLTAMHAILSRKIFYSLTGFDARKRMLMAAVNYVQTQPDLSEYLKAIVNKAGNYSGTRNMIVHGDVVFIGDETSRYFRQTIILQGRQAWGPDIPDAEMLTGDQLEAAEENFGRLAAVIHYGLGWTGGSPSPLEFLELIQELPNPAHSGRLDQTILARVPPVPEGNVPFHR